MIYITGDTHANFSRLEEKQFPIQKEMIKEDYVIICGDFGGVWTFEEENVQEKYWLDYLNEKNFTTLFVDGNHENFTRLYNYPVEEWHGGKVNKIRDSVLHLMRGEVFNIDNKKIFAFGGARSHDIQDGILNLDEAKRIYEDNEIELITSTPCIEKWYLLHYGYTTKMYQSSEQAKIEIKKFISDYCESKDVFPIIYDKTGDAIKNSKMLEKHQVENGQAVDNENCNPYTGVYKVVEELVSRNNR